MLARVGSRCGSACRLTGQAADQPAVRQSPQHLAEDVRFDGGHAGRLVLRQRAGTDQRQVRLLAPVIDPEHLEHA
ncbi:hypothetical protein FAF44_29675 [Nonomuraea sp. MG754425]|uniref:hypothetical protein n=1 Tax=Nonomuraea sp. MG754425 TaxID=2570319 RepID=UPI001F23F776|nr:hypothetical protein [Nonomuraea sp. MG754425]MCF6472535.1 hypothetical protein [Nonomuraea sp. MG754425]